MEPFDIETLKSDVMKYLTTDYDFDFDEAEEAVNESVEERPDFWHENADAKDLAKLLASEDENE